MKPEKYATLKSTNRIEKTLPLNQRLSNSKSFLSMIEKMLGAIAIIY